MPVDFRLDFQPTRPAFEGGAVYGTPLSSFRISGEAVLLIAAFPIWGSVFAVSEQIGQLKRPEKVSEVAIEDAAFWTGPLHEAGCEGRHFPVPAPTSRRCIREAGRDRNG
jgi:hypothetical protein